MRLYNLFPLLTGSLTQAAEQFPRIAAMGFDWLYLNPVHLTGGSRSLYAVASYDEIDPRFASNDDRDLDKNLRPFCAAARTAGLGLMVDLVINHTSDNHAFTQDRPHWYAHEADGRIKSPSAIDPGDPSKLTVWGDLYELDYDGSGRDEMIAYFSHYIRHLVGLGVTGFRCDAAYKVPAEVWAALIHAGKEQNPQTIFAAETLGCRLDQIEALAGVGFDYFFNSSKWWDMRASWAPEQYNQFRGFAPSIAFPESHDTPRLAAETEALGNVELAARYARLRYALACCFSSGVMLPIGYEYGFKKPLHVVETTPKSWEQPTYDISAEITALNHMKAACPALNVEGALDYRHLPGGIIGLVRFDEARASAVVFVANPGQSHEAALDRSVIESWLGVAADTLIEITPGREGEPEAARLTFEPYGFRIFEAILEAEPAAGAAEAVKPEPMADWKPEARITIEAVTPVVDAGRFSVRRIVGQQLDIAADIFCDGHDVLGAAIHWRQGQGKNMIKGSAKLRPYDNDRWTGSITLTRPGLLFYRVEAWLDAFESWRRDTTRKFDAGQDITLDLAEGRELLIEAGRAANVVGRKAADAILRGYDRAGDNQMRARLMFSPELRQFMARWGARDYITRTPREFPVTVDRVRAEYGSWYEFFPRSQGKVEGKGSSFIECIDRLPDIARMGFDVVYLTPIHPIGRDNRKGPDNTLNAKPGDPGSPYAIGSTEGGHDAVHPELGTLEDFRKFVGAVKEHGMEVALDFAVQCAPDHPWVKQHRDWFTVRADGTIKYAENPPKKYQDIVNVNFYGGHREKLWHAIRDVVLFWVDQGVEIFRVDNPHTKPLPFWEWLIAEVKAKNPNVLFLAEAFTRPKMMAALAKAGFTQSYTYFTWRNTKAELTDYMTELTQSAEREFFRPNFFVNTPDILPKFIQTDNPAAFRIRAALAATLSGTYGIYSGYELCEGAAIPNSEEYLHSEKYEVKVRDWNAPGNIKDFITRLNEMRRGLPALQTHLGIHFHEFADDKVLFFAKQAQGDGKVVFVAVLLDPTAWIDQWIELPLKPYGLDNMGKLKFADAFNSGQWASENDWAQVVLTPDNPLWVRVVGI